MSAKVWRRIHLILMIVWLVVGLPVSIYFKSAPLWLAFLMIYQIVVGHWGAWSSERPTEN